MAAEEEAVEPGPLAALWTAVAKLHEESGALRECLTAAGVLSEETFLARLHRRHFAAARRAHPPVGESLTLVGVLGLRELGVLTAKFAGLHATRALEAGSLAAMYGAGAVMAPLRESTCRTGARVYVCGGRGDRYTLSSTESFNPILGVWETVPPMSQRRAGAAAVAVAGCVFVIGGRDGPVVLNSAERFDPLVSAWEALPRMAERRADAAAAAVAGRVYVMGGRNGMQVLNSVERLQGTPSSRSEAWEGVQDMLHRRAGAAAAAVGSRIYIFGGRDGTHSLSSAQLFDPAAGLWAELPEVPQRRLHAAAAVLAGRVHLLGGREGLQVLASVAQFDPAEEDWDELPAMAQRRVGAAAAVTGELLYVFGGSDGPQVLSSAERFNLALGVWEALPAMSERRLDAVAAVVAL